MHNSKKRMTSRERVLAALHRKPVDRVPYIEHLVDSDVAFGAAGFFGSLIAQLKIGRALGFSGIINDLKEARKAQNTEVPILTPGVVNVMSAAEPIISEILNRDNITFWGSFGCFSDYTIYMLDQTKPELGLSADGIIKKKSDLKKLIFRDIDEVIDQAKHFLKYKGDFAACAMIYLGIDPTWHSMGFETFSMALIQDQELVEAVIGKISDWYAAVAEELCKLDFDFIWAADDIAYHTSPMFSPKSYREVLLPHTRKVAEKITKPWIYHSDGNLMPLLDDLLSQGMNAIHPLEPGSMDVKELKNRYGDQVAFVGNISVDTLERGSIDEIKHEVNEAIDIIGPGYGYLMSSSNSITPNCKAENVKAMVETLLENGAIYQDLRT